MRLRCHLSLKAKNPGESLGSPGFGFVQPLLFFSGRPIGEPRLNNRYYDYDANYDTAKKKPTRSHICLLAESQCEGREFEVTIGHKLSSFDLNLIALEKASAV